MGVLESEDTMKVFHKECDGNTVGFACVVDGENFIEKRFSSEKETLMYCMALEDLGYKEVDAIFLCAWNKEKLAREDLEKICKERESFQKRLFYATQKFLEASNEFEKHKERYNITE